MDDNGIFGGLFDFDGSGHLDPFEKEMEVVTLATSLQRYDEEHLDETYDTDENTFDNSEDEFFEDNDDDSDADDF